MKNLLPLLLSLILITSCGSDSPAPTPTPQPGTHQAVDVILLVAPWCKHCMSELNIFDKSDFDRARIRVSAYAQTGLNASSPPDPTSAGLMSFPNIVVQPDSSIWATYHKFFPGRAYEYSLPKAVVTVDDESCEGGVCKINHELLTTFDAPYTVVEVLSFAKAQLKP